MKSPVLALGVCAAVMLLAAAGHASAPLCAAAVSGGTAAEQTAARQTVCAMPGTVIRGIEIEEQPPDAPANTLWLVIRVPHATARAKWMDEIRGGWEAGVASAAIRDRFARLGLRHVAAYDRLPLGVTPDPQSLFGIALPSWGIRRWTTGAPSRNLGKHAGSWAALQAKLVTLSRRYHVFTHLARYEPLGKAPRVTVAPAKPSRFLVGHGFDAYERALHVHAARYDGVWLEVVTRTGARLATFYSHRGREGEGCAYVGVIRGVDRICPSD
jgi:hypothetical protein